MQISALMHLALCTSVQISALMHLALCTSVQISALMHLAFCTWLQINLLSAHKLQQIHLNIWLNIFSVLRFKKCFSYPL